MRLVVCLNVDLCCLSVSCFSLTCIVVCCFVRCVVIICLFVFVVPCHVMSCVVVVVFAWFCSLFRFGRVLVAFVNVLHSVLFGFGLLFCFVLFCFVLFCFVVNLCVQTIIMFLPSHLFFWCCHPFLSKHEA